MGELFPNKFDEFCKREGIQSQYAIIYTFPNKMELLNRRIA